ncbi:hypothetical protein F5Y04DRAFT_242706 [Hypomontagnella monticulosa]|nr:hypothetical protein F5Y04DRAFT_242706 [Hypomontagnella monticulosa]
MLSPLFILSLAGLGLAISGPEIPGFCARNPLLSFEYDLCWSAPIRSVPNLDTDKPANPAPSSPSTSNQTGWDGPRHCVREWCVYSNRQFSGGIVVITNSENVERISRLPDTTTTRSGAPPFYSTEVPGKGVGLVANRTIRRGEPIMTWQPTYMIHRRLTEALSAEEQQRILDAALLKLPAARRRAFSRQLGQFGVHHVSDILLTNSFQMDVGGPNHEGHHLGNFPDVSRFNHDCRPNVAFRIDDQLTHHTHAVRDIAAGEELTLAYMNPFETYAVRQQHILESWGFKCTCRHCSMSEKEIQESDARLHEIDELSAELENFASTKASIRMVKRFIELHEKERLDAKMHGAHVVAALNYNLFGDAKNARKHARLAAETGIVEFGPEAGDVKAMEELAKSPEKHFTWRKRLRR